MKKLLLVLVLATMLMAFMGGGESNDFTISDAQAFEIPAECCVPVWNGANQAACAWALMVEIYGAGGDWPD